MATPNVGILTTAGKALIDKVNSGQAKISFSKIVFSSMDNSQLSDTQIKALTAISPQEVVVSSPETTLDTNSGETRIRATGTNEKLADGVYVKTYGVFAKDDTGSEILYGVTVSPNPNYFPAYDGVTPQAVTYSYKTVIQETSNITMTNSNDVYVSQEDLTEAIAAIPKPDLSNYATNRQLATKADDSKVVHSTDMRKPASDVAGIEEVNAKQDKIGYTPADDAKVAHLSGANNFDTVPMVNNNPLLLASSLPSDLARTSQQTNFTAGLKSGGVDVATAADLKSVENSAWRQLDNKYIIPASGHTLAPSTSILYKIDDSNHTLYLSGVITLTDFNSGSAPVTVQLGSIIKSILTLSVPYLGYNSGNSWYRNFASKSSTNLSFLPVEGIASIISTAGTEGKLAYVTYDELV